MTEKPPSPRSPSRRRGLLAALLLLSFGLNVVGIGWGLGGAWTWAPDEIRPGQVLEPAAWSDKYPPLHRHVLALVVTPLHAALQAVDSMPWQAKLGRLTIAQRLVSVLAAALVVLLVFRTASALFGERAGLPAAAVVVVSPTFVYYAKTANLEMAYLFWFTLSLWLFVRAWKGGRLRDFSLCSAAAIAAVTSKDQAYGLYPVLMAASVVRIARDHAELPSRLLRLRSTLLDLRLWGAIFAAATAFAVVYGIDEGVSGLAAHFEKIVGPNTTKYRVFERDMSGLATMFRQAVVQSAFLTGWPIFALSMLGVGGVVRDRRDSYLPLLLALVPLGYLFSFVWVVGFHFVRFYLPLLPIFAILAARGWLALAQRFPRASSWGGAAILLAAVTRCLAVDAAMLTDTRLEARALLEARPAGETAVGVGRVQVLPQGLEVALWGLFKPDDCELVDRVRPDWIVFNASDLRTPREEEVLRGFEIGQMNYDLEWRLLPRFEPPGWGATMSNLSFVSPELRIYRRSARPCIEKDSLGAVLSRPSSRKDADLERVLMRLLLREEWGVEVDAEGRAALFGTTYGGWTRATQPAVLALENPGLEALSVELRLAVAAGREHRPIPVRIEEKGELHRLQFGRETVRGLRLADLEPGSRRLVWIWSEKAWPGAEKRPRMLGVKLVELTLSVKDPPDATDPVEQTDAPQ